MLQLKVNSVQDRVVFGRPPAVCQCGRDAALGNLFVENTIEST